MKQLEKFKGLAQIKAYIGKQPTLIAVLAFSFIFSLAFSFWLFSPHYALLFSHLEPQDSQQILRQLEEAQIQYQLKNQGQDIFIDKGLVDKTRLQLMGSDKLFPANLGFELFDKTDFGLTEFSQKINYQRALQGELERSIKSLKAVKQARVHLVLPEKHLFQNETMPAQAAITLYLSQDLNPTQVISIERLISASIPKLKPSNIVIIDQYGRALNEGENDLISSQLKIKQSLEIYLSNKVLGLLNPIFAPTGITVKVDVSLNYDELKRELLKPQAQSFLTHEKESQHALPDNSKGQTKTTKHDFSREKSYQLGQEKELFTRASGKIERLSLSVVLPENTPASKCQKVENLVKAVVGFDAKRGDSLSVEALGQGLTTPPLKPKAQIRITGQEKTFEIWLTHYKPSKKLLYPSLVTFTLLSLATLLCHRRKRYKKRQILLQQLNQWLVEHG